MAGNTATLLQRNWVEIERLPWKRANRRCDSCNIPQRIIAEIRLAAQIAVLLDSYAINAALFTLHEVCPLQPVVRARSRRTNRDKVVKQIQSNNNMFKSFLHSRAIEEPNHLPQSLMNSSIFESFASIINLGAQCHQCVHFAELSIFEKQHEQRTLSPVFY